jgi:hypothetical protein
MKLDFFIQVTYLFLASRLNSEEILEKAYLPNHLSANWNTKVACESRLMNKLIVLYMEKPISETRRVWNYDQINP